MSSDVLYNIEDGRVDTIVINIRQHQLGQMVNFTLQFLTSNKSDVVPQIKCDNNAPLVWIKLEIQVEL